MMPINNCKFCNVVNSIDEPSIFSEEEENNEIKKIFNGQVTTKALSASLYKKIALQLMDGVFDGFGKDAIGIKFGTPDYEMIKALRENVFIFSAAKTYQETKHITSLLYKNDKLVPFSEFKKQAGEVFGLYNKTYLNAEYNTAIGQARSISRWQTFEKEAHIYPLLQYRTAGDGKVRPAHAILNGIVRPVNDKWWNEFAPLNGFNCRCTLIQVSGLKQTPKAELKNPTEKEVPEIFRFNAGKEKIIFSPKHPYFKVPKADKEFAKQNFNLPLP